MIEVAMCLGGAQAAATAASSLASGMERAKHVLSTPGRRFFHPEQIQMKQVPLDDELHEK